MVQQARGSRFVKQVEREQNIALLAERKTLTQQITAAKEKLGGVLPGLLKAQAKLRARTRRHDSAAS